MRTRRLLVTPQAPRDFEAIVLWYRNTLNASAAAKAARTIQAGMRATARVSPQHARRPDLPEGFRVVAKAHLVIFQIEKDASKIVRILHGARDIAAVLDTEKE